jgi:hypothetical protein
VPDIDIPEALVDLMRQLLAARRELEAFTSRVEAERRELHPGDDPEQILARAVWPEDLAAELERLRAAELELVMAVHRHEEMVRARAEGRSWPTEQALYKAARADDAEPAPSV